MRFEFEFDPATIERAIGYVEAALDMHGEDSDPELIEQGEYAIDLLCAIDDAVREALGH